MTSLSQINQHDRIDRYRHRVWTWNGSVGVLPFSLPSFSTPLLHFHIYTCIYLDMYFKNRLQRKEEQDIYIHEWKPSSSTCWLDILISVFACLSVPVSRMTPVIKTLGTKGLNASTPSLKAPSKSMQRSEDCNAAQFRRALCHTSPWQSCNLLRKFNFLIKLIVYSSSQVVIPPFCQRRG